MPRKEKVVLRTADYINEGNESSNQSTKSEDSFEDDIDPDYMEVPGGGKNLEQLKTEIKTENQNDMPSSSTSLLSNMNSKPYQVNHKMFGNGSEAVFTTPVKGNTSESLNSFQAAASSLLSSYVGGSPFAGLFSQQNTGSNSSQSSFDQNTGSLLGQLNFQQQLNNLSSTNFLSNKLPIDFNRFLANPAVESLYRAILGETSNSPSISSFIENTTSTGIGNISRGGAKGVTQRSVSVPVSQIWQNTNKVSQFATVVQPTEASEDADDEDEEEESMGAMETYAEYKPSKLQIGKRHPDPVVETASMASVLPPDVTYDLELPQQIINSGKLSALQLEAVTYACQQHEFNLKSGIRSGYLIGDGAGVGKGRTVAGIIYENWLLGRRKSIWVSVSADLRFDAERDLKDIGATPIKVHALNKLKYGKIAHFDEGVIFATYAALIGESTQPGKYNTRLKQLVHWCGRSFDGVIIFDECHRAKNLCPSGTSKPTKTGKTVHELQEQLRRARVVYASATGASEPRNMAYMTRLGIWGEGTPFADFQAFISSVEKRGVSAMEIVAMDMKLRGAYIARQLSFQGVTFTIQEVPLSDELKLMYDESVELWVLAMNKFIEGIELMGVDNHRRKAIWAQFWAAHQRFFKYLCIAAKVKMAVQIARDAVKDGKCVVIGLQSTGEARTLDQLERDEGELTDFVSTAKGVLQTLVEKQFPGPIPYNSHRTGELAGLGKGSTSSMFDSFCKEMEAEKASENGRASSSSHANKRKPVRKAAQKITKRVKYEDSDDSVTDMDADSDFQADESSDNTTGISDGTISGSEGSLSTCSESDIDEGMTIGARNSRKNKKMTKKRKSSSKRGSKKMSLSSEPSVLAKEATQDMKKILLDKIEQLGERLPPNTLDQLIDELGGPSEVAEMTGRKGRVIQDEEGNVSYETRSEADVNLECINLAEKERFMKGEKYIAIISEAASSGISLQSDKRVLNQRRRVHITLELPWSADRAIQQFGRTHRSNQVNAPEYVFLISDLAGEHRFASIVAKRLESLGALTHGDRRATESRDLSKFHIDNKFGRLALERVLRGILQHKPMIIPPPSDYESNFYSDMAGALVGVGLVVNNEGILDVDRDYTNISKFLNRILGMPVRLQNCLFKYFTDVMAYIVKEAKRAGRFDCGIVDIHDNGTNEILRTAKHTYEREHATGVGKIELHEIQVERGLSWEQVVKKHSELCGTSSEGFYLSRQMRNGKKTAIFAIADSASSASNTSALYSVYRPNTGLQARRETLRELRDKNEKIGPEKAMQPWTDQYTASKIKCQHAYWSGRCKNMAAFRRCEVGLRQRTYYLLSGSVLLVWGIIEGTFHMMSDSNQVPKMQVVRMRFGEERIVGILIPNYCIDELRKQLESGAISAHTSTDRTTGLTDFEEKLIDNAAQGESFYGM